MPAGVEGSLVAREHELQLVQRAASFADGPAALVVVGEAGIGKTTLWRAGIDAALASGVTVRFTTAAESEAHFAYAAIADLLRDLPPEKREALPQPQRAALEAALLLAEVSPDAPQLHAVAAAFTSVLRSLATDGPLLVAVDDVQWLDGASADVLAYAVRRTRDAEISFLLTRRPGSGNEVAQAVRLRPLSFGALQRLLLARGFSLSGRHLRRIHATSGGNPFFALELAAAIVRRGANADGLGVLPAPETLAALLDERLAGVAPAAAWAALTVASLAEPTVGLLSAALDGTDDLDAAEAAGLVVRERGRARLAHPLLGPALRARAPAPEVRALHLRLAELVGADEERARHLALGSEPPDEAVAAALEAAARSVAAQGAAAVAAELAREAFAFTDPAAAGLRRQRLLDAAQRHMDAGLLAAGQSLLAGEFDSFPPGPERARARYLDLNLARRDEDVAPWLEAADEADGVLRAEILAEVAFCDGAGNVEEIDRARGWAAEAVELAAAAGDRPVTLHALHSAAWLAAMQADPAPVERFCEAAGDASILSLHGIPRLLAVIAIWRGEIEAAEERLDEFAATAAARDEEWGVAAALVHRFELASRVGDRRLLAEAAERFEVAAAPFEVLVRDSVPRMRALVAALGGDVPASAAFAGSPERLRFQELEAVRARGLAHLLTGDPGAAVADLARVHERVHAAGVRDPGAFPSGGDLAEALVSAGDLERAEAVVEELEATAREQHHPWATVVAGRTRGLLLDARGERAAAEAVLREALAQHASLRLPLDEARTLFALGALIRRERRLRDAREVLETAVTRFETLDVPPLAARARDELARISGRRTASGLTATEARVATLVAEGLSNREVAARLVVSVTAVERHLTRIYAKLGIRTRADLARIAGESGGIPHLPPQPTQP